MQNQRVMLTKRLLKDSFIALLNQQSIHKISIRELCEKAGINRSTFYKYYGSQYDLLLEMEDELLGHIQVILDKMDVKPGEKSTVHLAAILAYLEENASLSRLLINNNVDPDFPPKIFSLPQIQRSLRKYLNSQENEAQYEYVSTFVIEGAYNMIRQWLNKEAREPAEEFAALIFQLVSRVAFR